MERKGILRLCVLVFSVAATQIFLRYYGTPFIVFEKFYYLSFLLRFGVPLSLVLFYFKWGYRDLGLGFPQLSRTHWIYAAGAFVLISAVVPLILLDDSYIQFYSQYADKSLSPWLRLRRFGLFTLSTFFGWQFIHRSFLLFGLKQILEKSFKQSVAVSSSIAVLWVMTFECMYHLLKPDLETWGMLLASPVFSLIAIKSKSLWLPLLLHFYIEALFICLVVFVA